MDNVKRLIIVYSPHVTRIKKYKAVRKKLLDVAQMNNWIIQEIILDNLPYFKALKLIANKLIDNDLIVAAGGDGVAQVTFNAVYLAKKDVIFTTIPLGNGNDISRAINGRFKSVTAVLQQKIREFYPLNLVIDGRIGFSLISYATFGATTTLVDYLNSESSRKVRRLLKNVTPAAAVPVTKLSEISSEINQLNFPDFVRDGVLLTDDSVGFFVISAAHNVLRLPKKFLLARSEFFFHHSTTKDKNLTKKIIMAGTWALKFPGEMSELEEINFISNKTDIKVNISGDNINLGPIQKIVAIRSNRAVKILTSSNF